MNNIIIDNIFHIQCIKRSSSLDLHSFQVNLIVHEMGCALGRGKSCSLNSYFLWKGIWLLTLKGLPPFWLGVSSFNPYFLFSAGGAHVSPLSRICVLRVCVCIYTCQSFLTIPHFQCGKGCNTFFPQKNHHLARKIQSWSILLHFHKGGPLRTS